MTLFESVCTPLTFKIENLVCLFNTLTKMDDRVYGYQVGSHARLPSAPNGRSVEMTFPTGI